MIAAFSSNLGLDYGQTGDFLKVSEIRGCHAVTEFQGRYPDQQVSQWKAHTFGLVFAVDLAHTKSNRNRDRGWIGSAVSSS